MSARSPEDIANAVLYEGYMLYPYRSSSVKNKMRWNFGVVHPKAYSEAQGGLDCCMTQTECLLMGSGEALIEAKIRFLQAIDRNIGEPNARLTHLPADPETHFHLVPELRVGGKVLQKWQEAAERERTVGPVHLQQLVNGSVSQPFALPENREYEAVRIANGEIAALITRTQEPVSGRIEMAATQVADSVYRLTLRVSNDTPIADSRMCTRERALTHALLSAHSILRVERGEFVSLLDPPDDFREFAAACLNTGTWPVLVGEEGQRGTMLSSPIILYDYPQIAPESAGNLFDGTEIDEILALRILTLTEEEKREMREGDERAREILERTETLSAEQFSKLHGVIRGLRSAPEDQP